MDIPSSTSTPRARGYGLCSLLPLVLSHKACISETAREQSVFHSDFFISPFSRCGCSMTPGFLTREKIYSFSLSLCLLITSSDEPFLNNKREGGRPMFL